MYIVTDLKPTRAEIDYQDSPSPLGDRKIALPREILASAEVYEAPGVSQFTSAVMIGFPIILILILLLVREFLFRNRKW